jgi:hypothetical protein
MIGIRSVSADILSNTSLAVGRLPSLRLLDSLSSSSTLFDCIDSSVFLAGHSVGMSYRCDQEFDNHRRHFLHLKDSPRSEQG